MKTFLIYVDVYLVPILAAVGIGFGAATLLDIYMPCWWDYAIIGGLMVACFVVMVWWMVRLSFTEQ